MNISIVIPLLNEEESLPELAAWIDRVMKAHSFSYEVIFVDDGSKDGSWKIIEELGKQNQAFKGIKFRRNYGKAAALNVGFNAAAGDVVNVCQRTRRVVSRTTSSSGGRTARTASPLIRPSSDSVAMRPMSYSGWRIVVSGGVV